MCYSHPPRKNHRLTLYQYITFLPLCLSHVYLPVSTSNIFSSFSWFFQTSDLISNLLERDTLTLYKHINSALFKDVDECLSETACGINANCKNTGGSFSCTCPVGYRGNPYKACQGKIVSAWW